MIRDKRKDDNYFRAYIGYQIERISKKEKKLVACNGDKSKVDRINLSLVKFKGDLVFAAFSSGYEKNQLKGFLQSAIDTASDMSQLDYELLLNFLALSVILDDDMDVKKLITQHKGFIYKDKLLKFLASYLESGEVIWEGEFVISELYDKIECIDSVNDKEGVLCSYLEDWYSAHKGFSWYESDKGIFGTYVGYWSFESAAIAKIYKIAEERLRENVYYPVL